MSSGFRVQETSEVAGTKAKCQSHGPHSCTLQLLSPESTLLVSPDLLSFFRISHNSGSRGFFFFFFNNIHSLLTFKCYPSPPKEHCVKQTENFGNIWKAPVWVSKLKAMGRGKRQRTGYSCPTGSQLLVSTWTVSLPWPTKLDTICSQLSPL